MRSARHPGCLQGPAGKRINLAVAAALVGAGIGVATPRSAKAIAWNATDPSYSAPSTGGLTDNYGQFTNESYIQNNALSVRGTCTYLANGWFLTAQHVAENTGGYGTYADPSQMQINIYGQNYTADQYSTFGSADVLLIHVAGYTGGNLTTLTGVEKRQLAGPGDGLAQVGGFGLWGPLGTTMNSSVSFHRAFTSPYVSGPFLDINTNSNSRLVTDGYVLGMDQGGDSGSGMWEDNGPSDQDLDLNDWSLTGVCQTGGSATFGSSGGYGFLQDYSSQVWSVVYPHAVLTWNANSSAGTAAVDGSGTWDLSTTNFTDGTNYAFNGPERTEQAIFGAGSGAAGTVTLGATIPLDELIFNAAGSGTYTIAGPSGDSLNFRAGGIILTNVNATISANITGGSSTQEGAVWEVSKEGTGTLTLTEKTTLDSGVTFHARAGTTVIANGASFNAPWYASIAVYSGESAMLSLQGTGSFTTGGDFNLGDLGGSGTLNVQDTATLNAVTMYIGKGSGGSTGAGGTGIVNQIGGSITAPTISMATNHPLSVGTYNLTGGTLNTSSITGGLGTSTFNFNGGQLIASANSTTFMQTLSSATINAAAVINTNSYNVTLAQPLLHASAAPVTDGGLTKTGNGTLTLGGLSTYTGPTAINAGTLALNPAAGAAAVAIQPVASYSFDNVSGTTVVNGGTGGTAMNGTLTGNATIVSGGKFGKAVSLSGGGSVSVASPITDTGGAANWTLSAWVNTTTPGSAIMSKSDGGWTWDDTVFYLGDGSGAGSGGIPSAVRYGRGFFQAGSSTPLVDNGSWHLVTYVDAAGNYSIYTDGNPVALSSGNSSFIQAVQQGGTVTFGATTDGGDGTVNFNGMLDEIQIYNRALTASQIHGLYTTDSPNPAAASSVLPATTPVTLASGATLDVNGVSQTIGTLSGPTGATIKLGSGQLNVSSNSAGSFAGIISGVGGSLSKSGSGTLVLSGNNTYTGATTINGGILRLTTSTVTAATPIASYSFAHLSGNTVINDGSGGSSMNGTLDVNGGTGSINPTGGPAAGMGALVLKGNGTTVDINSGITDLSSNSTWTVSAWVKTTQAGATILDKGNGSGWNSGYSTFYLGNGNNAGSGSVPDVVRWGGGWVAGSSSVTDGNWHLLTYTDSAGTKAIYVDGVTETLSQNQFLNTDTGSVVRIGFAPTTVDGEVATSGSLSGINIYNAALSPAQVAGLYSAVVGGSPLPTTTSVNIAPAATLDVNGTSQTIASLNGSTGSSVTLGSGTLTLKTSGTATFSGIVSGTGSIAMAGTGTQILGGNDTYTGNTTVTSGTLNLGANQLSTGILVRNSSGIAITGGKLIVGSALSHSNHDLISVGGSGLSFGGSTNAWTGALDLGSNDMDIANAGATGLATITNQLKQGYANGAWNGAGIDSSVASSTPSHLTALGVILNGTTWGTATGSLGTFDTINPGTNDVLIKYTYYGDANLDGQVTSADYTKIDNGFLSNSTGWGNGDFNYDSTINGSDYTLIDNAFNSQGAQLTSRIANPTASIATQLATSVPEPAGIGSILFTAIPLLRRRKSRGM